VFSHHRSGAGRVSTCIKAEKYTTGGTATMENINTSKRDKFQDVEHKIKNYI